MKKLLRLTLAAAVVLMLAGCGKGEQDASGAQSGTTTAGVEGNTDTAGTQNGTGASGTQSDGAENSGQEQSIDPAGLHHVEIVP